MKYLSIIKFLCKLSSIIKGYRNIFIVILILIINYWYLQNYKQKYESFLTHNKIINEENKINFIKKFELINEKYCDSKNETIRQYDCLNNLNQLDLEIQNKIQKNKIQNYEKCNECFKKDDKKSIIYYHTFWQFNSLINDNLKYIFNLRVLKLNLMSYLSTQNLCCTKFILWKTDDFPSNVENEIINEFQFYFKKDFIQIKTFNFKNLCILSAKTQNSVIHKYSVCHLESKKYKLKAINSIGLSDFVRFVVLDIYGGIYTDGDVIYLKDMSLLWNFNFAYRWSYTKKLNTAILGINKNFKSKINNLYDLIFSDKTSITSIVNILHPFRLTDLLGDNLFQNNFLTIFHSFLFDPAWLCFDGIIQRENNQTVCDFDEFNKVKLVSENEFKRDGFFLGAFTYHLHLAKFETNIKNDSYFAYFETYFKKGLKLNLN